MSSRLLAVGPAPVAGLTLTSNGARPDRHYPQEFASGRRSTASRRAARTHGFGGGSAGAGGGAVSRRKRSTAATTAAASSGEADGRDDLELRPAVGHRRGSCQRAVPWGCRMPTEVKPRLRGVFHQWAFLVSLVAGAGARGGAPDGPRGRRSARSTRSALAGMFGASALYHRVRVAPVAAAVVPAPGPLDDLRADRRHVHAGDRAEPRGRAAGRRARRALGRRARRRAAQPRLARRAAAARRDGLRRARLDRRRAAARDRALAPASPRRCCSSPAARCTRPAR